MKLIDLIDLELQLAHDEGMPTEDRNSRDRAIVVAWAEPAADGETLLLRWLEALRKADHSERLFGERLGGGLRAAAWGLTLLGLILGWGAAAAVLRYDGSVPVNVLNFLWVFVGFQLLLLLLGFGLLLLGRLRADISDRLPIVGDLRGLLRALIRWGAGGFGSLRKHMDEERWAAWRAGFARLHARASLYKQVESWQLLHLSQTLAVTFNLGALAYMCQAVAFSDLAFAWSTTLDWQAEDVHRIASGLSLPWAGWLPNAAPTLDLVDISRWSRLDGAYVGAAGGRAIDSLAVGGWWPFCIMCLVAYGLLPRLLLLFASIAGMGLSLARVPLDRPDIQRVLDRLTAADVRFERPTLESAQPRTAGTRRHKLHGVDQEWLTVVWRDAPINAAGLLQVPQLRGKAPTRSTSAGGLEHAATSALLAGWTGGVVVAVEAWEAPDKALRRFLTELRSLVSPKSHIVVALFGKPNGSEWTPAGDRELATWRDSLADLQDPWLLVEGDLHEPKEVAPASTEAPA